MNTKQQIAAKIAKDFAVNFPVESDATSVTFLLESDDVSKFAKRLFMAGFSQENVTLGHSRGDYNRVTVATI